MTRFDDLDRALVAFFEGETVAPAPSGLLDLVADATARKRPRPTWSAAVRQTRVAFGWDTIHWEGNVARLLLLGLLVLGAIGAAVVAGSAWWPPRPVLGVFTPPVPVAATAGSPIMRLPDGRTLIFAIVDGRDAIGVGLFDPETGTIRPVGTTIATPEQVAVLPDGRVLVLGQGALHGSPWVSAEVFDPRSGSSILVGEPGGTNVVPIVLPDGRFVLFKSGLLRTEIFDPADGSSTITADPPFAGYVETAVRLADGRVLLVQDFNEGMGTPSAPVRQEVAIFDPQTLRYTSVAPLPAGRIGYSVTALPDGTLLLAGGAAARADATDATATSTAWRFDPATGAFVATGPMRQPRWMHRSALMADGRVLIIGGSLESIVGRMDDGMPLEPTRSTEIYDPATGRFEPGPDMTDARVTPSVETLADGSILVLGGFGTAPGSVQTAERFR